MLLRRFLDVIKRFLPEKHIKILPADIARLNPEKITIEEVRNVLNKSYEEALDICETAVDQGFFTRKIALYRPDGTVARLFPEGQSIPEYVYGDEEIDGHFEEREYRTNTLKKRTVYSLAIG